MGEILSVCLNGTFWQQSFRQYNDKKKNIPSRLVGILLKSLYEYPFKFSLSWVQEGQLFNSTPLSMEKHL